MSSAKNKLAHRQASLTFDSTTINVRRKSLVKQNSEDLGMLNSDFRITVNSKIGTQQKNFPPPKIAWEDDGRVQEPIIAKRCPENRKPPRSLKRQSSMDQDSILSCKEDIINKLRLLLKDEKEIPEKQNINIFLNQNPKHHKHDESNQFFEDPPTKQEASKVKYNSESTSVPSLFQFRNNPLKKLEPKKYPHDHHQDKPKDPPNIIVPQILEEEPKPETKPSITDNSQPINNIIIRPSTAKSRREMFGQRTNSAFHSVVAREGSNQRPPLQRSSSAPIRPEHAKSKFLATKRKLKTVKKKDAKSSKKNGNDNSLNMDCTNINNSTAKNGADIITMVSLVSPASSDIEEISEIQEEECKSRTSSPKKILSNARKEEIVHKTPSLRRIVKQVSFQQSSIHAIRSFSAGFPGRKNSMVTSMMLGGSLKRASTVHKKPEKGITNTSTSDDEERVPKRRLLRSQSAHMEVVGLEDDEQEKKKISEHEDRLEGPTEVCNIPANKEEETVKIYDLEEIETTSPPEPKAIEQNSANTESQDGQQFFTPKEKECWTLYQKMSGKGVNVNYDTLLRGMLTPTEYRNRRQSLAAMASLAEESEESVDKVEAPN
ncbi:uncharacterized protein LOC123672842 [Harmonia axyridis]|uniref:uncharacterized protein LOC123672842 n=1 Tax=Harmonia axyridis TaxID=115357 RepID=UPI001E276400|nr:uncharacterized protein LOC123672842 [Harmonia axyridis]